MVRLDSSPAYLASYPGVEVQDIIHSGLKVGGGVVAL